MIVTDNIVRNVFALQCEEIKPYRYTFYILPTQIKPADAGALATKIKF
jgi:hypothetical protein